MNEQSEHKRIQSSHAPREEYERRSREESEQPKAKFKDLFVPSGENRERSERSNSRPMPGTQDSGSVRRIERSPPLIAKAPKRKRGRSKFAWLWEFLLRLSCLGASVKVLLRGKWRGILEKKSRIAYFLKGSKE